MKYQKSVIILILTTFVTVSAGCGGESSAAKKPPAVALNDFFEMARNDKAGFEKKFMKQKITLAGTVGSVERWGFRFEDGGWSSVSCAATAEFEKLRKIFEPPPTRKPTVEVVITVSKNDSEPHLAQVIMEYCDIISIKE